MSSPMVSLTWSKFSSFFYLLSLYNYIQTFKIQCNFFFFKFNEQTFTKCTINFIITTFFK